MNEFNQAKRAKRPVISGTAVADSRFGRRRFLLIPSKYLTQDQVICVCPPAIRVPANWSYVKVHGRKRVVRDHYEIIVDDVLPAKIETPVSPEIEFRDFQELLIMQ